MVFTAVILYYLVNAIGISASAFSICYYMPLLFGTLTPIVVYLIGKEVYDRRSGLLAAFFIAVSPAIIQRQVVGFFDNEPFGIFIMLVSFYFFLRALKRGSVPSAITAGFFLGYLCISWGTFRYAIDIFALFAFIMLITRRYSIRLFTSYSITMLLGLFIGALAPRNSLGMLINAEILPAWVMLGLMLAYESSKHLARIKSFANIGKKISTVNPFLLVAVVAVAVFLILQFTPLAGKFYTVIMPFFRETQAAILASVGEHQPTPWSMFFYYLGIILVFSIVGVYFSFRRLSDGDIFMILATITLVYFSASMVRIVITLAPILTILAGYGLSSVLRPFGRIMVTSKEEIIHRKRMKTTPAVGREYAAAAFLLIGVILFSYGNMIITPTTRNGPAMIATMSPPEILAGGTYTDWLEAMTWLNNAAPPGSVVVAWWDYGYYITVVGNRTSVDDNATVNSTQIAWVGLGFMQTNETASLEIFRRFHADYALVYFGYMITGLGGDEGKWIWMLRIAADYFPDRINKTQYFNETGSVTQPLFFNTTLYRLLFNNVPSAQGQFDQRVVFTMGTASSPYTRIATESYPAIAPDRTSLDAINSALSADSTAQSYGFQTVTAVDDYGPMFFKKAFYSSHNLVKIYKIDYSPLDMVGNLAINASDTHLYKNGTAVISARNTGSSSAPAIPFNYWTRPVTIGTQTVTQVLVGTIWINGTVQSSLSTLSIWNSETSSWISRTGTYYLDPGQTVKFRLTGLNTNIVNTTQSMPLTLYSAYSDSIYAQISITPESG